MSNQPSQDILSLVQQAILQERTRREYNVFVSAPHRVSFIAEVPVPAGLEAYGVKTTCTEQHDGGVQCIWADFAFRLKDDLRVMLESDFLRPGVFLQENVKKILAELSEGQEVEKEHTLTVRLEIHDGDVTTQFLWPVAKKAIADVVRTRLDGGMWTVSGEVGGTTFTGQASSKNEALLKYLSARLGRPAEVEGGMSDSREPQFAGFAASLWKEIDHAIEGARGEEIEQKVCAVLARRAYDLVNHTLWHTTPASGSSIKKYRGMTIEQITSVVPDLTKWPKVEEE